MAMDTNNNRFNGVNLAHDENRRIALYTKTVIDNLEDFKIDLPDPVDVLAVDHVIRLLTITMNKSKEASASTSSATKEEVMSPEPEVKSISNMDSFSAKMDDTPPWEEAPISHREQYYPHARFIYVTDVQALSKLSTDNCKMLYTLFTGKELELVDIVEIVNVLKVSADNFLMEMVKVKELVHAGNQEYFIRRRHLLGSKDHSLSVTLGRITV
jgi:hypothetical protein